MKKLIQFSFLLMLSESIFAQSYTITPNSAGSKISNSPAPFTIGMRSGFSGVIDFMRGAAFSAGIRNSAIVKQLRLGIGDIYIDSNADIVIDSTTRYIGIRTINPLAQLHIKAGTSNVNPFANTNLFLENNNHNYLHLGAANSFDNGILFSNTTHNPSFGGGIIYKSDDRMSFVMNGGTSRMLINSLGNVGIGTTTPTAKLDVNGTAKIGTNGTVINEIIRHTHPGVSFSQNPNPGGETTFIISVPNAQPGSAIAVTTSKRLPAGVIQNVSCEVAGEIRVGFYNTTSAVVSLSNFDINIAVIR